MQTVLVIDDNAAIRMIIADFIKMTFEQTTVKEATDGLEGIALINEELPDLILLDAEMPNMDGFEVVKRLKESEATKNIPVIAISSGATGNPIVAGLRAMSDANLPKPFTPDELINVVDHVRSSGHIVA